MAKDKKVRDGVMPIIIASDRLLRAVVFAALQDVIQREIPNIMTLIGVLVGVATQRIATGVSRRRTTPTSCSQENQV